MVQLTFLPIAKGNSKGYNKNLIDSTKIKYRPHGFRFVYYCNEILKYGPQQASVNDILNIIFLCSLMNVNPFPLLIHLSGHAEINKFFNGLFNLKLPKPNLNVWDVSRC